MKIYEYCFLFGEPECTDRSVAVCHAGVTSQVERDTVQYGYVGAGPVGSVQLKPAQDCNSSWLSMLRA